MKKNVIKRKAIPLALSGLLALMCCASNPAWSANDATSFDPTKVKVTAKGTGGVPVGTIIAWPSASQPEDPENWLECDGRTISATDYPELFAVIGGKIPDYQGVFLRGYGSYKHRQVNGTNIGETETVHASAELGEIQGDAMRHLSATYQDFTLLRGNNKDGYGYSFENGIMKVDVIRYYNNIQTDGGNGYGNSFYAITFDNSRMTNVDIENRPINVAVRYFIRALP